MVSKVLVAMSGGVDSSVTAALLKEQGYQVTGATIKMWPASSVAQDARRVADSLGIPFYLLDFTKEFQQEVIDLFIQEYKLGKTPNPCVLCNRAIKFGLLLEEAKKLGIGLIATGHYAIIQREETRFRLCRGKDKSRDQSYFLYTLTQDKLQKVLFPIGTYSKGEIRALAKKYDLASAGKPDSQDICFLSGTDYKKFLADRGNLRAIPGDIVDRRGQVIGHHTGIYNFTVGQRRGLGVAKGVPLYVVDLIPETNTVVAGGQEELLAKSLVAEDFNWIRQCPQGPVLAQVQIRYNAPAQPAWVVPMNENQVRVEFERPQRAIAPGQAAVAYDGEEVLGGGKIALTKLTGG